MGRGVGVGTPLGGAGPAGDCSGKSDGIGSFARVTVGVGDRTVTFDPRGGVGRLVLTGGTDVTTGPVGPGLTPCSSGMPAATGAPGTATTATWPCWNEVTRSGC